MNQPAEPNSSPEQQKEPVVPLPPPKSRLPLLLTFVFLVVLILVGGYMLMSKSSPPPPQPIPTQSPTISIDPTANWEKYSDSQNRIQFKLPESYVISSETDDKIDIGFYRESSNVIIPILTISFNPVNFIDYQSFPLCSEQSESKPIEDYPNCISDGTGWGQAEDVMEVDIGGKKARSFYIDMGIDNQYHLIQILDEPQIEAKMYVSGGGLDGAFNQILSTFRFLNK